VIAVEVKAFVMTMVPAFVMSGYRELHVLRAHLINLQRQGVHTATMLAFVSRLKGSSPAAAQRSWAITATIARCSATAAILTTPGPVPFSTRWRHAIVKIGGGAQTVADHVHAFVLVQSNVLHQLASVNAKRAGRAPTASNVLQVTTQKVLAMYNAILVPPAT